MEQQLPKPFNEHTPFLSDEQMEVIANLRVQTPVGLDPLDEEDQDIIEAHNGDRYWIKYGMKEARATYEPELERLRAQVEAMRVAGQRLVGQLGNVLPCLNGHIRPALTEVSVTIIDAWTASLNPTPTAEPK